MDGETDGLTFASEVSTGLFGFDADVAVGSGVTIFYNYGNTSAGRIYAAAHASF